MYIVNERYNKKDLFQTELVPKLSSDGKGDTQAMDTDSRILDAYINQCTAEAQEGTIH